MKVLLLFLASYFFTVQSAEFEKLFEEMDPGPRKNLETFRLPGMFQFFDSKGRAMMGRQDEVDFEKMERQALIPWIRGWKAGQTMNLFLFRSEGDYDGFYRLEGKIRSHKKGIVERDWIPGPPAKSRGSLVRGLNRLLARIGKIEHMQLDTEEVLSPISFRNPLNLEMFGAWLTTVIDVRGSKGAKKTHLQGRLLIRVEKIKQTYRITSIRLLEGKIISSRKRSFRSRKYSFKQTGLRRHAVLEGFDLQVCRHKGKPYIQTSDDAHLYNIDPFKRGRRAIAAVKDQDVIFRSCPDMGVTLRYNPEKEGDSGYIKLAWPSGTWSPKPDHVAMYRMPIVIADFDGSGKDDILPGFPLPASPRASRFVDRVIPWNKIPGMVIDGKQNNPGVSFYEEKDLGLRFDQQLYPLWMRTHDMNGNGRPDVVSLDDNGALSISWSNQGNGFSPNGVFIHRGSHNWGRSFELTDLNRDGLTDIVLANARFSAIDRMKHIFESHYGDHYANLDNRGLVLLRQLPGGKWKDDTRGSGLNNPGQGVSHVLPLDYNGDGLIDLYVSNGIASGLKGGVSLDSYFVRRMGLHGNGIIHNLMDQRIEGNSAGNGGVFHKILSNGNRGFSLAGNQRNRLYRNNGDGTWTDVAFVEGVDSTSDSYMAVSEDLNGDGLPDIVLRNRRPYSSRLRQSDVEIFYSKKKTQLLSKKRSKDQRPPPKKRTAKNEAK